MVWTSASCHVHPTLINPNLSSTNVPMTKYMVFHGLYSNSNLSINLCPCELVWCPSSDTVRLITSEIMIVLYKNALTSDESNVQSTINWNPMKDHISIHRGTCWWKVRIYKRWGQHRPAAESRTIVIVQMAICDHFSSKWMGFGKWEFLWESQCTVLIFITSLQNIHDLKLLSPFGCWVSWVFDCLNHSWVKFQCIPIDKWQY